MTAHIEIIPDPARTLQALRDIGYSLQSAVADLVDNAVSARAGVVSITFARRAGRASLVMRDDGAGMEHDDLVEAMRVGSRTEYDEGSLGKYGLGLKSASLSQARRLTVASRPSNGKTPYGLALDLAHVEKANRWEFEELDATRILNDERMANLWRRSGTCVVWEDMWALDTALGSASSDDAAGTIWGRALRDLQLHLAVTFHHFLAARDGVRPLKIIMNTDKIEPRDPFCRDEEHTLVLQAREFRMRDGGAPTKVVIRPYILPARSGSECFSSNAAWSAAKGLLSWNDSQGLYIYRNGRLIHSGGWLGIRAKDEHTKYARIGLFFDTSCDSLLRLSVNKAQVRLPSALEEFLRSNVVPQATAKAQQRYRGEKGAEKLPTAPPSPHGPPAPPSGVPRPVPASPQGCQIRIGRVADGRIWLVEYAGDGRVTAVLNQDHPFVRLALSGSGSGVAQSLLEAVVRVLATEEARTTDRRGRELLAEVRDALSEELRGLAEVYPTSPAVDRR